MAITLKQLAHARALAHHRSFREAAVALNLTQPALTRSMQTLEHALGVTLFDRLAGGVEPTEPGKRFLLEAGNILRDTRELEREMGLRTYIETGIALVGMMLLRPEGLFPNSRRKRELHAEVTEPGEDEMTLPEVTEEGGR